MEEDSTLKLTLQKGPRGRETLEFRPGSVIRIGRVVRGNTVSVKDAGVSSKHLSVHFVSGKWVLTDLDTSNGTVLNGSSLRPMDPTALSSGDSIKIGEYTSIEVEIEIGIGGQSRLRRNPRRREEKTDLGSVGGNSELGFGRGGELGNGVEVVARRTRARVLKNPELEKLEELSNGCPIAPKNQNQTGRPRRARVLKIQELNKVEEVNNVGSIETINENQSGRPRRARVLKNQELEKVEEVNNVGPIEMINENCSGRPRRAWVLENKELETVEEASNVSPSEPKNENQSVRPRRGWGLKDEELGKNEEVSNVGPTEPKNLKGPGQPRKARVLDSEELEKVIEMGNVGPIEAKNQKRPGRPRKARVLDSEELEKVTEMSNVGPTEPKNQKRPGWPRKAGVLKNEELETVKEMSSVGPIESKQGRRASSRRAWSSMKEENLNSHSFSEKSHENSSLDGNNDIQSESLGPVEDVKGKRMHGATRRKRNLEDDPLKSAEDGILKEVITEGLNLQPEDCEDLEATIGNKENLSNGLLEEVEVDVPEQNEEVENLNLRRERDEEVATVSGVKEGGVDARDEPDLEKMTLGEWFAYLEIHFPKEIHVMTEEMISNMRHKADLFHEFMLQRKIGKDEDKLSMG